MLFWINTTVDSYQVQMMATHIILSRFIIKEEAGFTQHQCIAYLKDSELNLVEGFI